MLLMLSGFAAAQGNLLPPQQVIDEAAQAMKQKLQTPGAAQNFTKITEFVEEVIYPKVDFNRISALVLGRYWKEATPDQQERFKREFQTLLVRTYARAFVEFKEWSVRFLPLQMNPEDTKLVVKSQVLQPGLQPISVDYRMVRVNNEWKVYDIMIEGVSLVTNYRNSFRSEIERTGSLDSVIQRLAQRNEEALRQPAQKS